MAKIAVIGAGLSGLVVARRLATQHDVVVFEKSRGVGGRMATRYAGPFEFDHGAQFFTARTTAFQDFLQPLIRQGIVANWRARFVELQPGTPITIREWGDHLPHCVGTPRMNSVGKWLASALDVRLETPAARLDESRFDEFDWVVSTVPAAQAAALVPESGAVRSAASAARMQGCFALMLGFDEPLGLPWEAALVRGRDISWISVNSSKPGRPDNFTLVVHSTNAWADDHMDDDPDGVAEHMLSELAIATGTPIPDPAFRAVHRWRYANIVKQAGPGFAIDPTARVAACGDWFVHGRVEAAFSSARALLAELELHLR